MTVEEIQKNINLEKLRSDFYGAHSKYLKSIVALFESGTEADRQTVCNEILKLVTKLEKIKK